MDRRKFIKSFLTLAAAAPVAANSGVKIWINNPKPLEVIDIEVWIKQQIVAAFQESLNQLMLEGSGMKSPKGFLISADPVIKKTDFIYKELPPVVIDCRPDIAKTQNS